MLAAAGTRLALGGLSFASTTASATGTGLAGALGSLLLPSGWISKRTKRLFERLIAKDIQQSHTAYGEHWTSLGGMTLEVSLVCLVRLLCTLELPD